MKIKGAIDLIYTEQTKKAMKLCFEAHRDQTDKSGMPYVFHPIHLAEQMTDEATTVTALLHDVVEDTDYTIQDLREMGFRSDAVDAIALMTHDPAVPYMNYVAKIKDNPIARAVKLADLRHNSDITRLDHVDDLAMARVTKYLMAIDLLEEPSEAEKSARNKYEYDAEMKVLVRCPPDGEPMAISRKTKVWETLGPQYESYARAIYIGQGCWERLTTISEELAFQILRSWGCSV